MEGKATQLMLLGHDGLGYESEWPGRGPGHQSLSQDDQPDGAVIPRLPGVDPGLLWPIGSIAVGNPGLRCNGTT